MERWPRLHLQMALHYSLVKQPSSPMFICCVVGIVGINSLAGASVRGQPCPNLWTLPNTMPMSAKVVAIQCPKLPCHWYAFWGVRFPWYIPLDDLFHGLSEKIVFCNCNIASTVCKVGTWFTWVHS